jgi:DNA-binding response OmpR family regulator
MNTILLIDDNEDYRADLMEILEFENYVALGAENGLVGLEMIRQNSPDLVVCDLDMPGMNGIEVLKAVKSNPFHAKIPFIVASGRNDELTKQTVRDLGADIYLTKPVSVTEFLATIVCFLQTNNSAPV